MGVFNKCSLIQFIAIKEINRLRKEINRLLSKEMSNNYLKVAIEENYVLKTSILEV